MREARAVRLGEGTVLISGVSGAPIQFVHPADASRTYLLPETVDWHSIEHEWGSGSVVSTSGSARWNTPDHLDLGDRRTVARFELTDGLSLSVHRDFEDTLRERFTITNTSRQRIEISALAVQTPFADHYPDARSSLATAVNAHLFCGGEWAWAAAQPMSGAGPVLGLSLTRGAIRAYSIESRNQNTMSNARGHIVLNVTDRAHNAAAFGGQPLMRLEPDESYTWEWTVGWYDSVQDFLARVPQLATVEPVAATIGQAVVVRTGETVSATGDGGVHVVSGISSHRVTAERPGVVDLAIGAGSRAQVFFHEPVEQVVKARASYITRHQRSSERPGLLRHALVPIDTRTLLTQSTNGWSDWTDGSERIGMAVLLQQARNRGWLAAEVDEHLQGWSEFARAFLVDESGAPRRGSQDAHTGPRLYDAPWLTLFFLERFRGTGDPALLDFALKVTRRSFALGAGRFLAVFGPEVWLDLADTLAAAARAEEAAEIRAGIVASADSFLELGSDLPPHEVAYEHSIVAPLVSLMSAAYTVSGQQRFLTGAAERLPWLLAFGGPQPDARLRDIPIRHWDGFWFGLQRMWGDVFPHYWAVLTAATLEALPAELRSESTDRVRTNILHAGMINFSEDGSATCAFVMPSSVDGRSGHLADPLANDQDWHLAIWLWMNERFASPLD